LKGTPAAEVIPGTAQAWILALTADRVWDEGRDASRIRKAFTILSQTRTEWPAPRHFTEVLPDSTQVRLAGPGERPVDPPELRAVMAGKSAAEVLGTKHESKVYDSRAVGMSDAARELQAAIDRKSAAAGDA